MATNAEIVDLMMARLGERRAQALRAKVALELNNKIQELDKGQIIPWFLQERYTGTLTAGVYFIATPSGFTREAEGPFKVKSPDGQWLEIKKLPIERLEEADGLAPGFPEAYSLYGDQFIFAPTPLLAYDYKFKGYKTSGIFVENGSAVSNKWLLNFANYTTLSALLVVAHLHTRSDKDAAAIEKDLNVSADMFFKACEAREHANMQYLLGNTEN